MPGTSILIITSIDWAASARINSFRGHHPQLQGQNRQLSIKPQSFNQSIMTETVYFVTGASRGIGLEFIKQLIKRTNSIVYAGIRTPSSLKPHFPSPPKNLHILQCDVTSDTSVTSAIDIISKQSGRLDILINNAAIDHPFALKQTSISDLRNVLETNLIGVHRVIKTALPLLKTSTVKKVINLSSDFGSVELNDRDFVGSYSISKAALNMLTVQYKNEYFEEGIIFIPLHPGDVCVLFLVGADGRCLRI